MNKFAYLFLKTIKNGFLKLVKKPTALIGYLLIIGLVLLNVYNASDMETVQSKSLFGEMIYLTIVIIFAFYSILVPTYQGTKKFTLKFLPADSVYLMSAPVKPRQILWYGQLKQSITTMLLSLLMFVQIPTLRTSVGLDDYGILLFILGFFMVIFVPSVITLSVFVVGLKFEKFNKYLRFTVIVIGLVCFGILALNTFLGDSYINGFYEGLVSPGWLFVPIVGWIYYVFVSSLLGGITYLTMIGLVLIGLAVIASFYMIYKFADEEFYEEAINQAFKFDKIKKDINSGKSKFEAMRGDKKRRTRKLKKVTFRKGVLALFDKETLITRKKGYSYFDLQSLVIVGIIISGMYITSSVSEIKEVGIFITLGIICYAMFLVQIMNGTSDETDSHYIFLFPYNPVKKLFAITLWSGLKVVFEGVIGFSIASFFTEYSLIECLLAGVFVGMIGYAFNMVSIVANNIFGPNGTMPLKIILRMIIDGIIVVIGVIVFAVSFGSNPEGSLALPFVLTSIYLIITSIIFMLPASLMVYKPEFNK